MSPQPLSSSSSPTVLDPTEVQSSYPEYTSQQLRDALDSLLTSPADTKHLYGYNDNGEPVQDLSKLQSITAHRILDYQKYMSDPSSPTMQDLEERFQDFCTQHGPPVKLDEVIRTQSPRMALAAEFKRASPSKGDIAPDLKAGEQATVYAEAGADIISVLTEPRWFRGGLSDLTDVRLRTNGRPSRPAVLRKEFVTNTYQITEAAAHGADTILLIVAVLPPPLLKELIDHARSLGMEALVEVHADAELEVALQAGAKVIGVNNRNLHTFEMDLRTTEHVAEQLKTKGCEFDHNSADSNYVLCALSGMSNAADVARYRDIGVGMCLIGESLMRASDPAAAIAGLCLDPKDYESQQNNSNSLSAAGAYVAGLKTVKVCGVTNGEDALVACQAGADLIGVIFVPRSKRCVSSDQAREVVEAVRRFGERKVRASPEVPNPAHAALSQQLLACAASMESERRPMVVGVFQNQDPEFIRQMVEECGLDMVQLHGNEGMAAANSEVCGGVPAIRVVDIETDPETGTARSDTVERLLNSLTNDPAAILLDTSIKGDNSGGGTGVTFDWRIAEQIQNSGIPVLVAGGLTPDNVADAVSSVRPWGIDVSSGVEQSPGKKDHEKVRAFVSNARKAAIEANKGF